MTFMADRMVPGFMADQDMFELTGAIERLCWLDARFWLQDNRQMRLGGADYYLWGLEAQALRE